INEAYHTLINPEYRKTYDRTGSASSAAYARRADSAAAKAARRAYYQQRADHIVNEWLEREREETRARGKAGFTTVTLFVSTFFAALFSGFFALDRTIWRDIFHVTLILLFVIGVRPFFASLKGAFVSFTYRQPEISLH